jgi:hypothetical protein
VARWFPIKSIPPLCFALCTVSCASQVPLDAPEFVQRAAPREGQNEIALLAQFKGRLAIEDGCLGAVGPRGEDDSFVTLVWPFNARIERDGNSWRVRNERSGETIKLGQIIKGGGGFRGAMGRDELRDYNRSLTSKLSRDCADKGTFGLNKDLGRG